MLRFFLRFLLFLRFGEAYVAALLLMYIVYPALCIKNIIIEAKYSNICECRNLYLVFYLSAIFTL